MQENSPAVLLATGALPALILLAAVLTLPVCLALLALYRRGGVGVVVLVEKGVVVFFFLF